MPGMTITAVKSLLAEGRTDSEIGAVFGRARSTVQGFRAKHGLSTGRPAGKTRRGGPVTALPVGTSESASGAKIITVAEFLLNKRRAVCPVCRLKEPVRALVADARKKGERQADIIEYLQVCHRVTITPREFAAHIASRHDV